MEEESPTPAEEQGHYSANWRVMSPEIVEIVEENKSMIDGGVKDVYVAVGKNDLHVVKWALDHAVSPGGRVFLVHVFPPVAYIPTPVGRLSRNQLSKEQVQFYLTEESNRRRDLLEKYIRLCDDAKVAVDTMLVESNAGAKAILDLIPIANITNLVVGAKQSPLTRLSRKGLGKGEYIQKNAPKSCEVNVVYDGKNIKEQRGQITEETISSGKQQEVGRQPERNFLECMCFSGKST